MTYESATAAYLDALTAYSEMLQTSDREYLRLVASGVNSFQAERQVRVEYGIQTAALKAACEIALDRLRKTPLIEEALIDA